MNIRPPLSSKSNETKRATLVRPKVFNGIYVIGDVPYDGNTTLPFSNSHYGNLAAMLRPHGVAIENCVLGVVCEVFPHLGVLNEETAGEVDAGMAKIRDATKEVKPSVILILGRQAFRYFKRPSSGLDEERGTPFFWEGHLCLATYHPKEVFMEYHNKPVVEADYAKALAYVKTGWKEETYDITYQPSFSECVSFLQGLLDKRPYVSTDWESQDSPLGKYSVATCIGFGINGKRAFTIPLVREGNKPYFELTEEVYLWRLIARVLETCPQIGHNALHYDHWFAAYWCKIMMHVVDDTMFAFWEVYTELASSDTTGKGRRGHKSLSFLNSLYCQNPYWKDEMSDARAGRVPRNREFLYNGKDNIITLQAAKEIGNDLRELPPSVKAHYRFNVRCSRIFQYMSLRGAIINKDKLNERIPQLSLEAEIMERKLVDEAKCKIKVTSPKQMKAWLYESLRLPVRTKPVKQDDGTVEERETADFLTLMYLAREYPDIPALLTAAKLRKLYKRVSSLKSIQTGPNGECYWNFNLVGTETGRASGYKPNSGLGVQPQNVDKRDRDLFEAGRGMVWGKCDLEGADAWTVAGQLATLGDATMLEDLRAGLKPAMILAMATAFGEDLIKADQATLCAIRDAHKGHFKTASGKQTYDVSKAVSHGTNYMMQAPTMHMTIFAKSKGELFVPIRECEKYRLRYLSRYSGLSKLYEYIPTIINSRGYIDCPSGMRRVFFGRPDNHRTRVGLALIPQNNTAFATNRALHNLYYQSYNRRAGSTELIVQPMNQVHDEADIAFYENELPIVRDIFTKATDFESEVWGVKFKIPFDPNYGPNWGDCDQHIYGGS